MESNRTLPQNHSDNSCYSDSFNLDATAKIGQMLAYIAIFVFSLIGNSLIAMVFHREKGLRTTVLLYSQHGLLRLFVCRHGRSS